MAANYWASTQHHFWQSRHVTEPPSPEASSPEGTISPAQVSHQSALIWPKPAHVRLFFHQQLFKLGCRLNARQIVLSTANVYVHRFYSKVAVKDTNPFMLLATAFYLACKIEECPHHIRVVIAEARGLWQDLVSQDTAKLGECEFHLISELDAHLIVHHPYSALEDLQMRLSMSSDDMNLAWTIINDHYATDLTLQHPPHVIAAAAVIMASVVKSGQVGATVTLDCESLRAEATSHLRGQDATDDGMSTSKLGRILNWLSRCDVDSEAATDCMQQLMSLYASWETYSDRSCKEYFVRLVKEGNV